MSGVNGIGVGAPGYVYSALSSGSKVQTAAQGASEMAILQEQQRQIGGYNAGTENMKAAKNALNIADGATAEITENLQRMRELALKASNGLMSSEDKEYIQGEIDGLKQGIAEIAERTNYNGVPLLDNEEGKVFQLASDANGTERSFETVNATLDALGISDFDVTGDFDLKAIDNAMSMINKGRSQLGAQTNAFEAAIGYNDVVSYNTTAAQSRTGDTEYGEYIQRLQKQRTLEDVQLAMQKKRQEDEERSKISLFQ
ncbi:MAG: flagellin FliC5 [Lachnospiraceae bacterium]|nr:flagellin FliC5 [Lachnospiraceae bacterium]